MLQACSPEPPHASIAHVAWTISCPQPCAAPPSLRSHSLTTIVGFDIRPTIASFRHPSLGQRKLVAFAHGCQYFRNLGKCRLPTLRPPLLYHPTNTHTHTHSQHPFNPSRPDDSAQNLFNRAIDRSCVESIYKCGVKLPPVVATPGHRKLLNSQPAKVKSVSIVCEKHSHKPFILQAHPMHTHTHTHTASVITEPKGKG